MQKALAYTLTHTIMFPLGKETSVNTQEAVWTHTGQTQTGSFRASTQDLGEALCCLPLKFQD